MFSDTDVPQKPCDAAAPDVTVITVCLNAAKTIARAIDSVLMQRGLGVQFVVIDGASSDGTQEVVSRYADEIDVFISEPDLGIYDAMNKGLALASGKWIALLNADDAYISPDALARAITCGKNSDIVASDVLIETWDGPKLFAVDYQRARYRNIPYMHTGMVVRRELYSRLGTFRTDLRIASDVDFVFRLLKHRVSIAHCRMPLVRMADDGASVRDFKVGRSEYRRIYRENGGNVMLAYWGYWSTLIEFYLYRKDWVRMAYRWVKKFLPQ